MRACSIILICLFCCCAAFRMPFQKKKTTLPEYPGVDPALADRAVRQSRNYFVTREEEEESVKYAALGNSELEESETLLKAMELLKMRVKADTAREVVPPKEKFVETLTDDADIVFIRTKDTTAIGGREPEKAEKGGPVPR